jgi:hypothetical protein
LSRPHGITEADSFVPGVFSVFAAIPCVLAPVYNDVSRPPPFDQHFRQNTQSALTAI